MPIGQIDYATIQRTSDVEAYRHHEEAKPVADQQNIQVQVEQREDTLRHQVIDPHNSEQTNNHTDAKEEGKNRYSSSKITKKNDKKSQHEAGRVIRKQTGGFDIKI
jgi:hypothetical protein